MKRKDVFQLIAEKIQTIQKDRPTLVGISGVDGAGKTYFTKALVDYLKQKETRPIVSASVDYFHNPASVRYQKGKDSPEGFYRDSYNYDVLRASLLDPFFEGKGEYKTKAFDVSTDKEIISSAQPVVPDSILIMEGIFLFRPELFQYWDLTIFLDVGFDITLQRNIKRAADQERIGAAEKIIARYKQRYMPGQQLYLDEAKPKAYADILIDNHDVACPKIQRISSRYDQKI